MPVPNSMADLATLASSNFPTGTEAIGNSLDNYIRAISAIIRSTNAIASASIASASTTDIGLADGECVTVTGSSTINSLGSGFPGCVREVYFSSSLTITHSASLVLPWGINMAIGAGNSAVFRCVSSGVWRYVGGNISNPVFSTVSDGNGNLRTGSGGLDSKMPRSGGILTGPISMNANSGANQFIWMSADGSVNRFYTSSDEFALTLNSLNDSGSYNGTIARFSRTSLDLTVGGNIVSNSDETLKRNWDPIPDRLVEQLATIKAGEYERIDTGIRQVGVGAQSLQAVMGSAVTAGENGVLSVAYGNAALVGVVALCRRVLAIESRLGAG